MTRIRLAFIALVVGACQSGHSGPAAGYTDDIDRICRQQELSGALNQPESERALSSAYWLERHLATPEGRKFSATIFPLAPAAKADRLAAEAARVGLPACPTADAWRGGGKP
ncbi:MAG TPA: hypothetical protein VL172_03800 [Kofleriaceae bacterium]|nr:hypothetical protein [Kofleriaceae bacterium]